MCFNLTANKSKLTKQCFQIWFYIAQNRLRSSTETLNTYLTRIVFASQGFTLLPPFNSWISCTTMKNAPSKLQLSRCINKSVAVCVSEKEQQIVRSDLPRFWYHCSRDLLWMATTNSDFPDEVPCPSQHGYNFQPATTNPNESSQELSNTKNVRKDWSPHPKLTTFHTHAVSQSPEETLLASDVSKELESSCEQIFETVVYNNNQLGQRQNVFQAKKIKKPF